jgi:hypothetical protein
MGSKSQLGGDGRDFYQFSNFLAMLSRQTRSLMARPLPSIRNRETQISGAAKSR